MSWNFFIFHDIPFIFLFQDSQFFCRSPHPPVSNGQSLRGGQRTTIYLSSLASHLELYLPWNHSDNPYHLNFITAASASGSCALPQFFLPCQMLTICCPVQESFSGGSGGMVLDCELLAALFGSGTSVVLVSLRLKRLVFLLVSVIGRPGVGVTGWVAFCSHTSPTAARQFQWNNSPLAFALFTDFSGSCAFCF